MSDDNVQRLLSDARDDAERQRLLAALHTEVSGKEPVRELFELTAFYLLIGVVAFGVAYAANHAGNLFLPDAVKHTRWYAAGLLLVFFLAALAINLSFDGDRGAVRKQRWQGAAREYGYPLTLIVGLYAGYQYYEYSYRNSYEGEAHHATLAACADLPACLKLARDYNSGDDVEQFLRSPGR